MTDLFKAMNENRKEAISALKSVDGNMIEFKDGLCDDPPFVLISDEDRANIQDLAVTKVKLNENNTIDIYLEYYDEWMNENDCLSTSANNVYEKIVEEVFG